MFSPHLPRIIAVNLPGNTQILFGAVTAAVLGYQVYKDRHQPQGVHIDVGPGGLKIEGK